ncbi:MAG: hypothetical protein JSW58_04610 [Candidatus Latescibacterota bacterium]|nr:MAG: hypothetical protein JSW58_04610 [Candidatus Latescibacterota bacterium]
MIRSSVGKLAFNTNGISVLTTAVLLFFVAGCASSYHVNTEFSDDGTNTIVMANNEIKIEGGLKYHGESHIDEWGAAYRVERRCYLDIRKTEYPGGRVTYDLMLKYIGVDWLNMETGRSLELVIDGRSRILSGEGKVSREKDPSGEFVTESLDYSVSRDFLIRLAEAESVSVVITGHEGEVKGYFNEDNLANVRRFVHEFVRTERQVHDKTG